MRVQNYCRIDKNILRRRVAIKPIGDLILWPFLLRLHELFTASLHWTSIKAFNEELDSSAVSALDERVS
jgi:hypothetical protein